MLDHIKVKYFQEGGKVAGYWLRVAGCRVAKKTVFLEMTNHVENHWNQ